MSIATGHICTPTQFEAWTGKRMDPRLGSVQLTGARIMVVRAEPPKEWSGDPNDPKAPRIIIPEQVRNRETPGVGVVVAVGPAVGSWPTGLYPGGLECEQPSEALGLTVYFSEHVGVAMRLDYRDSEFRGRTGYEVIVMTDRDVQAFFPNKE